MLKHAFAAFTFAFCLAAPADAQDGTLPPVDTMNCDQMMAELMVAGQRMSAQMDPEFAAEAQRMNDEMQAATRSGARPTGNARAQTEENHARMNAQVDRLNASMEGIDQDRMMALTQRFEQQRCETPQ